MLFIFVSTPKRIWQQTEDMAADRVMPPIAGRIEDMEGLCLLGRLSCCINK